MLQVVFSVHGTSMSSVPVKVPYEGKTVNAMLDCLEVELTSDNGRHCSPTLRFVGDEIVKAQELFKRDSKRTVTVDVSPPEESKKEEVTATQRK